MTIANRNYRESYYLLTAVDPFYEIRIVDLVSLEVFSLYLIFL